MKSLIKKMIPVSSFDQLKKIKYELTYKSRFENEHGYELNLKNPVTFNDKIFYRKYFGNCQTMATIADKVKVRDIVAERVGDKYLTKFYGTYKKLTIEDWEQLPEKFVLKTNHGSGPNHLEIVTDKKSADKERIIAKLNRAIDECQSAPMHEPFYAYIDKMILAEEYIESEQSTPNDYKFHCFKEKIYIQVDTGRYEDHRRSLFTLDWQRLPFRLGKIAEVEECYPPENLEEMIKVTKELAKGFDYIRVDLYSVNDKIYFGELTQTHGSGHDDFLPINEDVKWGKHWALDYDNENLYQANAPKPKLDSSLVFKTDK
ncbi:hypothetical protein L0B53_04245 [Vibrio sp. SS-MA-C1-2]|uniref:ATP-grasp fold amidoligase family protein n=1 Tax=Vibrio sp. SS-MA-C1-2 TaxID=2908646 RepID=UPI001F29A080|nr:ATP-grasp fold amidoligase family protein [Vibrio sp. SS-MA-C1-2]UJF17134.1 hypothetical protein L0B53_04245 [Vibrio sp. SS-MA-C1-2]